MGRYTVVITRVLSAFMLAVAVLCLAGAGPGETDQWLISPVDDTGTVWNVVVTPGKPDLKTAEDGVTVSFPGSAAGNQAGDPDISGLSHMVRGRSGSKASIRVVETAFSDHTVTNIVPVESTRRVFVADNTYRQDRVRERNQAVYGRDTLWPSDILRLDEAWMGTNKYIRLVCNPAQYNPVTGMLRVYSKITGELTFSPEQ